MAACSKYLFNRLVRNLINCSSLEQIIVIPLVCCVNATEECVTNEMKKTSTWQGGSGREREGRRDRRMQVMRTHLFMLFKYHQKN